MTIELLHVCAQPAPHLLHHPKNDVAVRFNTSISPDLPVRFRRRPLARAVSTALAALALSFGASLGFAAPSNSFSTSDNSITPSSGTVSGVSNDLVWNIAGDGDWDETSRNWNGTVNGVAVQTFLNGNTTTGKADSVFFVDKGKDIAVTLKLDVLLNSMSVDTNTSTYLFKGNHAIDVNTFELSGKARFAAGTLNVRESALLLGSRLTLDNTMTVGGANSTLLLAGANTITGSGLLDLTGLEFLSFVFTDKDTIALTIAASNRLNWLADPALVNLTVSGALSLAVGQEWVLVDATSNQTGLTTNGRFLIGDDINGYQLYVSDRTQSVAYALKKSDNSNKLVIQGVDPSGSAMLDWTGANGQSWRQDGDRNWNGFTDKGVYVETFKNQDTVRFGVSATQRDVRVNENVNVAAMSVATADYTFDGTGGITVGDSVQKNGTLTLSNSSVALGNSGGIVVYGTTDLNNATITLNNNFDVGQKLLVSGGNSFAGSGNLNLANVNELVLDLVNNASLTINTALAWLTNPNNIVLKMNTPLAPNSSVVLVDAARGGLSAGEFYLNDKSSGFYRAGRGANATAYVLATQDGGKKLVLTSVDPMDNATVTWTGKEKDPSGVYYWDSANSKNWKGVTTAGAKVDTFLNGDTVIFDASTNSTEKYVTLKEDVAVAAMGVGNGYTFSGGYDITVSNDLNVTGAVQFNNDELTAKNLNLASSGTGTTQTIALRGKKVNVSETTTLNNVNVELGNSQGKTVFASGKKLSFAGQLRISGNAELKLDAMRELEFVLTNLTNANYNDYRLTFDTGVELTGVNVNAILNLVDLPTLHEGDVVNLINMSTGTFQSNFVLHLNGQQYFAERGRGDVVYALVPDQARAKLSVVGVSDMANGTVHWTGTALLGDWDNAKSKNWFGVTDKNSLVNTFLNNDTVVFGDRAAADKRKVNVAETDVLVKDMSIVADGYEFSGAGNITIGTATAGGTLNIAGDAAFAAGTISAKNLMVGNHSVSFAANAVTISDATTLNGASIVLNTTLNPGKTLNLSGANSFTGNGTLNLAGLEELVFDLGNSASLAIANTNTLNWLTHPENIRLATLPTGAIAAGGLVLVDATGNAADLTTDGYFKVANESDYYRADRGSSVRAYALVTSQDKKQLLLTEVDATLPAVLDWVNDGSQSNTWKEGDIKTWDGLTTAGARVDTFLNGDTVNFGDRATNKIVNLAQDVTVQAMNVSKEYFFEGQGNLTVTDKLTITSDTKFDHNGDVTAGSLAITDSDVSVENGRIEVTGDTWLTNANIFLDGATFLAGSKLYFSGQTMISGNGDNAVLDLSRLSEVVFDLVGVSTTDQARITLNTNSNVLNWVSNQSVMRLNGLGSLAVGEALTLIEANGNKKIWTNGEFYLGNSNTMYRAGRGASATAYMLVADIEDNHNHLLIKSVDAGANADVKWTGKDALLEWDLAARNWDGKTDSGALVDQFLDDDRVTFGTDAATDKRAVEVTRNALAKAMTVNADGYAFSGTGSITVGDSTRKDGALKFANSDVTLGNSGGIVVNGSTDLDKATITLNNNFDVGQKLLVSGSNSFTGSGNLNLANVNELLFDLTSNASLSIANTLTFDWLTHPENIVLREGVTPFLAQGSAWVLVSAAQGGLSTNGEFYLNDKSSGFYRAGRGTGKTAYVLSAENNGTELVLASVDATANAEVTWTAKARAQDNNYHWDQASSKNWEGVTTAGAKVDTFLNGDTVNFDKFVNSLQRAVQVDGAVVVNDMNVKDKYTFSNANNANSSIDVKGTLAISKTGVVFNNTTLNAKNLYLMGDGASEFVTTFGGNTVTVSDLVTMDNARINLSGAGAQGTMFKLAKVLQVKGKSSISGKGTVDVTGNELLFDLTGVGAGNATDARLTLMASQGLVWSGAPSKIYLQTLTTLGQVGDRLYLVNAIGNPNSTILDDLEFYLDSYQGGQAFYRAERGQGGIAYRMVTSGDQKQLWLERVDATAAANLNWTGAHGDEWASGNARNWEGKTTAGARVDTYLDPDDSVVFGQLSDAGKQSVNVTADVSTKDMKVSDRYTFTGSNGSKTISTQALTLDGSSIALNDALLKVGKSSGSGRMIVAGSNALTGNGTLDLSNVNELVFELGRLAKNNTAASLSLAADNTLIGLSPSGSIRLKSPTTLAQGEYLLLVDLAGMNNSLSRNDGEFYLDDATSLYRAERGSGRKALVLANSSDNKQLKLLSVDPTQNADVRWTGKSGTYVWDQATTKSWEGITDVNAKVDTFLDNDRVIFGREITEPAALQVALTRDTTVKAMSVENNYKFTGDYAITVDGDLNVSGNGVSFNNKKLSASNFVLTGGKANFLADIDISGTTHLESMDVTLGDLSASKEAVFLSGSKMSFVGQNQIHGLGRFDFSRMTELELDLAGMQKADYDKARIAFDQHATLENINLVQLPKLRLLHLDNLKLAVKESVLLIDVGASNPLKGFEPLVYLDNSATPHVNIRGQGKVIYGLKPNDPDRPTQLFLFGVDDTEAAAVSWTGNLNDSWYADPLLLNWAGLTVSGAQVASFRSGDKVNFGALAESGKRAVSVATNTNVADMSVTADGYVFNGSNAAINVAGNLALQTNGQTVTFNNGDVVVAGATALDKAQVNLNAASKKLDVGSALAVAGENRISGTGILDINRLSSITFNMINMTKDQTMLAVTSGLSGTFNSATVLTNLNSITGAVDDTITLIDAGGNNRIGSGALALYNDKGLYVGQRSNDPTKFMHELVLTDNNSRLQLKLLDASTKAGLTWVGSDGVWDETSNNWQGMAGNVAVTTFLNGTNAKADSVIFDQLGRKTVTLNQDVLLEKMTVNESYTFTGTGGITTRDLVLAGNQINIGNLSVQNATEWTSGSSLTLAANTVFNPGNHLTLKGNPKTIVGNGTFDVSALKHLSFFLSGGQNVPLSINSSINFADKISLDYIDIDSLAGYNQNTTLTLISAGGAGRVTDHGILRVGGQTYHADRQVGGTMWGLDVGDGSKLALTAVDAGANTTVTWKKDSGTGIWSEAQDQRNWNGTVSGIVVDTFLNGDDVVFDDSYSTALKTVTTDNNTVYVASMSVGGHYAMDVEVVIQNRLAFAEAITEFKQSTVNLQDDGEFSVAGNNAVSLLGGSALSLGDNTTLKFAKDGYLDLVFHNSSALLGQGSKLDIDFDGTTAAGAVARLMLSQGSGSNSITPSRLAEGGVVVRNVADLGEGHYKLIDSYQNDTVANNTALYLDNATSAYQATRGGTGMMYGLVYDVNFRKLDLSVVSAMANIDSGAGDYLKWDVNGASDDWEVSDKKNWSGLLRGISVRTFLDNDSVTFGAGSDTVVVTGNGVTVANMIIGGDYTFTGGTITATGNVTLDGNSRLIRKDSDLNVAGDLTLGSGSVLNLGNNKADVGGTVWVDEKAGLLVNVGDAASLHADKVNFDPNAAESGYIDIDGYKADDIESAKRLAHYGKAVVTTDNGFENFDHFNQKVKIVGQTNVNFLSALAKLSDDGKNIMVLPILSWLNEANQGADAHGSFELADGKTFTLDVPLEDVTGNQQWDGKSLTKTGKGTLVLAGDNIYTGATRVEAGILQIGRNTSVDNADNSGNLVGELVIGDATVNFSHYANKTYAGAISDLAPNAIGVINKQGNSTLTLTGDNSFSGTTNVEGTLQLGNQGATGSLAGAINLVDANSRLVFFHEDAHTHVHGGKISGAGTLLKRGGNTLVLTEDNDATGLTTVAGGILQLGDGTSNKGMVGGDIVLANDSALVFDHSGNKRYDGTISGEGSLTKKGNDTLTLTGTHTYDGLTTVEAGKLQLGDGTTTGSVAGDIALAANTELIFNQDGTLTYGGTISDVAGTSGSRNLRKDGDGTLVLTGENAFTGVTQIDDGVLQLGSNTATGWVAGDIVNYGALVFDLNTDRTYSGVINGTGTLTKNNSNTLKLTGNNSFTGLTSVNAGMLELAGTEGNLAGDVALASGTSLNFNHDDGATDYAYAGRISGLGDLVKDGDNKLTLGGDNTGFDGMFSLNQGTLELAGDIGGFLEAKAGTTLDLKASAGQITLADQAVMNVYKLSSPALVMGGTLNGTLNFADADAQLVLADSTSFGAGSLLNVAGGNVLSVLAAKKLSFAPGAQMSFDLTGVTANNSPALLTLDVNPSALVEGLGGLDVRVALDNPQNAGLYDLLDSGAEGLISGVGKLFIGPDTDAHVAHRSTTAGDLMMGLVNGGNQRYLQLAVVDATQNGTLTWTGAVDKIWDVNTTANWQGTIEHVAVNTFLNGDKVIFGANTQTETITIKGDPAGTGIRVGDMDLYGDYSFSGGTIAANQVKVHDGAVLGLVAGSDVALDVNTIDFDNYKGWLNISGYSGSNEVTLIHSQNGISGFNENQNHISIGGSAGGVDYMTAAVRLDGNDIKVQASLSWYSTDDGKAHGRFTVVNDFTVEEALDNNTSDLKREQGWDGDALTKLGEGTLILSKDNTYDGKTFIQKGTLQLGTGKNEGWIATDVANEGVLVFNRSDVKTFDKLISGSGSVQQLGSGTVVFTQDQTYRGGTTIAAGATLQLGAGGYAGSVEGDIVNDGTLVINRGDIVTMSNKITSASTTNLGRLMIEGSGAITLDNSDNDFRGGITIEHGLLKLTNIEGAMVGDVVLSTTGSNNSLMLALVDGTTYAGTISGSGDLRKSGDTTLILTGDHSYVGDTVVHEGTLQLGDGGTTGSLASSPIIIANNAKLDVNRSDAVAVREVSGSGTINKKGAGVLTLSENSGGFTGTLNVNSGGLALASGIALGGEIHAAKATSVALTGNTIGKLVEIRSGALLTANGNNTLQGGLTVAGANTTNGQAAGTLELAQNATLTGDVTLSDAVLKVGGGNTLTGALDFGSATDLQFDLSGMQANDTLLTLVGTIAASSEIGAGDVHLTNVGHLAQGYYTLIDAGTYGIGKIFTTGDLSISDVNELAKRDHDSSQSIYGLTADQGKLELAVIAANTRTGLTWTNGDNNNTWDESSHNWNGVVDGVVEVDTFLNGDSQGADDVTFASTTAGQSITVGLGGVQVASMTVDGDHTFTGGTITVDGAVTVKNGGTLGLVARDAALTAQSVDFNGGALSISGFTDAGLSDLAQQIVEWKAISTTNGISNFNPLVKVANQFIDEIDFMTANAVLKNNDTEVWVTAGLTWNSTATNRKAHGDFTITGGRSNAFELDAVLRDNANGNLREGSEAWDGQSLTKKGDGTLILSADNEYTGTTTVQGGVLQLGNSGTQGSVKGEIVLENGSVLVVNRSNDMEISKQISGDGAFEKRGAGKLTLVGDHTYAGETDVYAGELVLSGSLLNKVVVHAGSTFDLTSTGSIGSDANGVSVIVNGSQSTRLDGMMDGDVKLDDSIVSIDGTVKGNLIANNNAAVTITGTIEKDVSAYTDVALDLFGKVQGNLTMGTSDGHLTLHQGAGIDKVLELANGAKLDVLGNSDVGTLRGAGAEINFFRASDPLDVSPMLRVHGDADIYDSVIHLGITGDVPLANVGTTLVLMETSGDLTAYKGLSEGTFLQGRHGVTMLYDFELKTVGHQLQATIASQSVNPQTKSLSEGMMSGITGLTQGGDLLVEKGLMQANEAVRGKTGVQVFGSLAGNHLRYNTGSHVDTKGFNALTGLAVGGDHVILGAFFEYGNNDYSTHNSFANAASVNGDGKTDYAGGGVLGRIDFGSRNSTRLYADFSGRGGKVNVDYNSPDLAGVLGYNVKFDSKSNYYGVTAGAGVLWKPNATTDIDVYGRYLWTRQAGNEVTLSTGSQEIVKFDDVDSHRARFGARITKGFHDNVKLYVGGAYEYEFDGAANASTRGYSIEAPELKGATGIGEFGFILGGKTLNINLGVQGYTGQREGVTGSLQLKYTF